MRTRSFILLLTILTPTVSTLGQGIVNFGNASSLVGWANTNVDRRVIWSGFFGFPPGVEGLPVSTNTSGLNLNSLRVALYYSPPPIDGLLQFYPASGGPASFRASTSANAGAWFGGNRTLDNIPPGTPAYLVVVGWDIAVALDPRNPAAKAGLWGASQIFQYTPPTSLTPDPSELLMQNFNAFLFPNFFDPLPEPSMLALLACGAAALLIIRRRQSE